MKKNLVLFACVAGLVACTEHDPESADLFGNDPVSIKLTDGKFKDKRDGNEYSVVKVGNQLWMAENLRYADSSKTKNLKGNIWCYENSKDNCEKYGPLYSWTAVVDLESKYASKEAATKFSYFQNQVQGICPENWRVPSVDDWNKLASYFESISGAELVGTGMKAVDGWEREDSAEKALNRFGFYALPAGRKNSEDGTFMSSGKYAYFWSSTQIDDATSYGWTLRYDRDYLERGEYYKDHGMSLRCVLSVNYSDAKISGDLDSSYLDKIPFDYGKLEYEGHTYKTIKIDAQTWMAENMAYKTDDSWCYNDDEKNCDKYGRLYSFEAAKTVCPEGWRLPTAVEFEGLADFVSFGKMLRTREGWSDKGEAGMNLWGFNALPAGGRDAGDFFDLTLSSYMWSDNQSVLLLRYYDDAISVEPKESKSAFSVRCIKEKE